MYLHLHQLNGKGQTATRTIDGRNRFIRGKSRRSRDEIPSYARSRHVFNIISSLISPTSASCCSDCFLPSPRLRTIEVCLYEALKEIIRRGGCRLIKDDCLSSLSRNFCLPSFSSLFVTSGHNILFSARGATQSAMTMSLIHS